MKNRSSLMKDLNLNIAPLLNDCSLEGTFELPLFANTSDFLPDFIALYEEKSLYSHTNNTCVAFYTYDSIFDNIDQIYDVIYYAKEKHLERIKDRFKEVKCIILPDYSIDGCMPKFEIANRMAKARIVGLWFRKNLNCEIIPNITFGDEKTFEICLDGYKFSSTICMNLKGSYSNPNERDIFENAIKYIVDRFVNLKNIIVYSVISDDKKVYNLFRYAIENKINILIPENTLLLRNKLLYGKSEKFQNF